MANSRHGGRPAIRQQMRDREQEQEMRAAAAEHSQRREVKASKKPVLASPGVTSFMAKPTIEGEVSVAN